jgi:cytochrome c-type biogenesis protein CcmH/NrfG
MNSFILIASLMLACCMGFVLPPLWHRAPAGAVVPRQRWPVIAVAFLVPLLAVTLYAAIGNPKALQPQPAAAQVGPEQIEKMVAGLAKRLAVQPNDADGWRMLARSYETLRRFEQAADAYRRLIALDPGNADLLVDYAVVLGMMLNTTLAGEPEVYLAKALAIDPNHIQALALSGSAALERGDAAAAVKPWKKILALVPADSDIGRSISNNIAKAEAR